MKETLIGKCHCGAVEFEVMVDGPLKDKNYNLTRCNCSLCRRRQVAVSSVPLSDFKVTKGADKLTLYQWNTDVAKHYFCSVCGTYTHHQRRSDPNEFGYNIACIEGMDPYNLGDVKVTNGWNHPLDR